MCVCMDPFAFSYVRTRRLSFPPMAMIAWSGVYLPILG